MKESLKTFKKYCGDKLNNMPESAFKKFADEV
jgi:hypothetical protein